MKPSRVEYDPITCTYTAYFTFSSACGEPWEFDFEELDLGCAEPKRPALNWNKPTPFDPFKDYTVKRYDANEGMCAAPSGLASPDLTASSHQVPAAFGSASLHDKSMAKKVLARNLSIG